MKMEMDVTGVSRIKGTDGNLYSIRFAQDAQGNLGIISMGRVEEVKTKYGVILEWKEEVLRFEISK